MLQLAQARCVIIVFVMKECPACHEYVPRFRQVAQQFSGKVPSVIFDVESPQGHPLADQFDIQATPTTMVLRRPLGAIKAEGALNNIDIQQLFTIAASQ